MEDYRVCGGDASARLFDVFTFVRVAPLAAAAEEQDDVHAVLGRYAHKASAM